jgi:hypothetical protein
VTRRSLTGEPQFWLASLLVMAIVILSIGNYSRWWSMHFYVGTLYFHHWLSFIGAGYIAILTPIYALAKRRSPQRFGTLLKVHVFGNLVGFLLISMHFTQHMGTSPQFAPTLGTGLTLYIVVALMVITGYMQRFRLAGRFLRTWRFVHVSLSVSFYIVLVVHVLHNLGVL